MSDHTIVTFTLPELWLLADHIRHEVDEMERWKYPPASLELNDQIAGAIAACEQFHWKEFQLWLSRHDLLVIDYNVRTGAVDAKKEASGKAILLKTYIARWNMSLDFGSADTGDITYKEAKERANTSTDTDADQNTD